MKFAPAVTLVALLGGSLLARGGATQGGNGDKPAVTLGSATRESFTKLARAYYAVWKDPPKAKKALVKLVAEVNKTTKEKKIADPLVALEDWRGILQSALVPEKPLVSINSHELKEFAIPFPLYSKAEPK